jgi:hypothetical protein
VADGEADWLVFSIYELEEPLDAELDMPSSQGASVMRGVTNRGHHPNITIIVDVLLLRAQQHKQWTASLPTTTYRRCNSAQRHGGANGSHDAGIKINEMRFLDCRR